MKKLIFFSYIILSACSIQKTKTSDEIYYPQDNKCFEMCMAPDIYSVEKVILPIYNGKDIKAPFGTIDLLIKDIHTGFVRKNDVWCQIDLPPTYQSIVYLSDTINYRDFEYKSFDKRTLVKSGNYTASFEVVCKKDLTESLYFNISTRLVGKGYLKTVSSRLNPLFQNAITNYCRENELPVGKITVAMMKQMGIEY